MSWSSVDLLAPAERHDAMCGLLEGAGALAITSLDAGDRPLLALLTAAPRSRGWSARR